MDFFTYRYTVHGSLYRIWFNPCDVFFVEQIRFGVVFCAKRDCKRNSVSSARRAFIKKSKEGFIEFVLIDPLILLINIRITLNFF
jgi:hypothetical protein